MAINSPLSTTNGVINITSGTGTISIGADAVAKTLNLGNSTGATAVVINSGTGGIAAASTGAFLMDAAGALELNSSAGVISIGNDAVAQAINVGTGAAARVITIGNVSGASTVNVNSGTGGINMVSTGSGDIIVTSADQMQFDSANAMEINSSAGAISIGNDAVAAAINIGTGAAARTITIGNTSGASGLVFNVGSAGISVPSFATAGAVVLSNDGILVDADASTAGYVLTSNGAAAAPSFQAPAAGGMSWVNVTGTSASMAVGSGYIANNAGLVTLTLPATAAVGSVIAVQGNGAGGWTIAQNASQVIHFNAADSTAGVGGSVASSNRYDVIYLICSVANTDWVYTGGFGNYNVV